ncbi:cytochrome b/b6 domain-containing protein [Kineobactrum salinum]|uniref:Cytochrome B n=1 Tax=Kineobactrum salinum TaxID=2708301 RepID=A0A6C0TZI5_9GAMM|nr:cytochrome b/b6 domain-containing protein [Kineobactrum salinum]QIB65068.1 cytochrome B [Kineobactrum salinum]
MNPATNIASDVQSPEEVFRHPSFVRVTHWFTAAAMLVLIPSGLLILWAHPELYWGETGYFGDPAWLRFPIEPNFLGSLLGRPFHFFAAWVLVLSYLVYLVWGFLSGHFWKRMLPTRAQLHWRHIRHEIVEHALFRRATGKAALEFNLFQKLAYISVIFVLIPLMLLSGLTMSPGFTAAIPELFWLWGRQTARSVHFIGAGALVLFLIIHVIQLFVVGFKNEVRSMTTGRFVVPQTRKRGKQ